MRDQIVRLLPALGPALIVVALLIAMRGAPRLRIQIDPETLVVTMLGRDALFCCRRQIAMPVGAVAGVCVSRRDFVPAEGLRLPGTSMGRVIRAGSFGTGDARDFWDVRGAETVLVIECKAGAAEYRRLVLQVPDAYEQALKLRPVLGAVAMPLAPAFPTAL